LVIKMPMRLGIGVEGKGGEEMSDRRLVKTGKENWRQEGDIISQVFGETKLLLFIYGGAPSWGKSG